MNRFTHRFQQLDNQGHKALAVYFVAGDPDLAFSQDLLHTLLQDDLVDVIEIGVPFSDPMAEGVVIQQGHERAIAQGAVPATALKMVADAREKFPSSTIPIIFMGYANSFFHTKVGNNSFIEAVASAGADGCLIVDLPYENEADEFAQLARHDLQLIRLVAPTTPEARRKEIASVAQGFLYNVSYKGVTGGQISVSETIKYSAQKLSSMCKVPVLTGFGVRTPQDAERVAEGCAGAVVGSVIVDMCARKEKAHIIALIKSMKQRLIQ